jgi:hypothetical protein
VNREEGGENALTLARTQTIIELLATIVAAYTYRRVCCVPCVCVCVVCKRDKAANDLKAKMQNDVIEFAAAMGDAAAPDEADLRLFTAELEKLRNNSQTEFHFMVHDSLRVAAHNGRDDALDAGPRVT